MKLLLSVIVVALFTLHNTTANAQVSATESAITAFADHPDVRSYVIAHPAPDFGYTFEAMTLSTGPCGADGCEWQRLVSMTVTEGTEDPSSRTFVGLVRGTTPLVEAPSVEIVEVIVSTMPNSFWDWPREP